MTERPDTETESTPKEEPSSSATASEDTSAPPAEAASEAAPEVASEAASEAAPEEPSEGASETSAEEGSEADAGAASEASDEQAGEDGERKKKKRRRKKKKKDEEEGGAKRDSIHPFQRFFEGYPRKSAFAVGELVAGRIVSVGDGAATLDLFGRATAFTSEREPRTIAEIAVIQEPTPEPTEQAPSADASAEPADEAAAVAEKALSAATEEAGTEEAGTEEAATEEAATEEAATEEAATEEAATEEAATEEAATEEADELDEGDEGDEDVDEDVEEDEPEPEPEADPLLAGTLFRGRVGAVSESGHLALFNRTLDRAAAKASLVRARQKRRRVMGLVFGFNRGGFDVLIEGLRAFCPASGMDLMPIDDPHGYLGKRVEFSLQAKKEKSKALVVSRRNILERESRKKARELLRSLKPGQRFKGTITNVRDFGIFVDIGGIEGLVHQSELDWDRSKRPQDVGAVGDEIEVQVLRIKEAQSKKDRSGRLSLSIKALLPDPWDAQTEAFFEGQPLKGVVVRTTEFGAFVAIAPGVDGLLHISELGRDLKHASQGVKNGDEVHVVIERVDLKQRRISLSKMDPEEVELFEKGDLKDDGSLVRLRQGANIRVKVVKVDSGGLEVRIEGMVGKRGRGFIPNVEMGTARGTDHRRQFAEGTEIDVKIIGTDRSGGLRLSRKRFLNDEERRAVRDYKREASKQGFGTFGDLLQAKLKKS